LLELALAIRTDAVARGSYWSIRFTDVVLRGPEKLFVGDSHRRSEHDCRDR
jgi:hypothetical protein